MCFLRNTKEYSTPKKHQTYKFSILPLLPYLSQPTILSKHWFLILHPPQLISSPPSREKLIPPAHKLWRTCALTIFIHPPNSNSTASTCPPHDLSTRMLIFRHGVIARIYTSPSASTTRILSHFGVSR